MLKHLYLHFQKNGKHEFSEIIENGLRASLGNLGFEFVSSIELADAVITDSLEAVTHLAKLGLVVIQYVWTPSIKPYQKQTQTLRVFRYVDSHDSETFDDMASFLAGID